MPVKCHGSPYHKRRASKWGAPNLGSDKTPCPDDVADSVVEAVFPADIAAALERGHVSALRDGDWPRYAWGRSEFLTSMGEKLEIIWEARVENRGVPVYKAYPITRERCSHHMPMKVREVLWPRD